MATFGKDTFLAVLLLVLSLGALIVVFSMSSIFLPVFFAFLLAYLLNPLVDWLENRRMKRALAIVLVFLAVALLLIAGSLLLVDSLRGEFRSVELNLPEYANRLYEMIPHEIKVYLDIETPEKVYRHISDGLARLRSISFSLFREAFAVVTKAFTSTLAFVLAVVGYFITPVYLYYLLLDFPALKKNLLGLAPERYRETLQARLAEIDDVLSSFVRGQLSVCAILAVLYSVGLYFIGIDLALVIGSVAGITFIIPYVGTILGIFLSMLMALLKFHDLLHPMLCLGWFLLVQGLEGAIITPKIVGDKVGLHPVLAIIALFVGGQLFGILGMLIAVPAAAVLKVFLRSIMVCYRETDFYKGV